MRRLALALSLVFIVPFLALVYACSNQVRAQEVLTTWRAGDLITYRTGCFSEEAILESARGGAPPAGQCFGVRTGLAAQLLEWIEGPFEIGGVSGSAWRVRDAPGDIVFILLADDTGPHQKEARI